jgi:hypothetical protein
MMGDLWPGRMTQAVDADAGRKKTLAMFAEFTGKLKILHNNSIMTKKEWLRPRYMVIANYPQRLVKDDEENARILIEGDILEHLNVNGIMTYRRTGRCGFMSVGVPCVDNPERYPKVFRRMEWWEKRTIDDLITVKFVKVIKYRGYWREGDIVPAILKLEGFNPKGYSLKYDHFQPIFELEPSDEEDFKLQKL